MAERDVTLKNEVGLHARPAAVFSKKAIEFSCDVTVEKDGRKANAKSIMSVLKLDVRQGDQVTLRCEGDDAGDALPALVELIESL